jgi:hypothetical protein
MTMMRRAGWRSRRRASRRAPAVVIVGVVGTGDGLWSRSWLRFRSSSTAEGFVCVCVCACVCLDGTDRTKVIQTDDRSQVQLETSGGGRGEVVAVED